MSPGEALPPGESASLWQLRAERSRLLDRANLIARQIRDIERAKLVAKLTRLTPHQRAVAWSLVRDDTWSDEDWFVGYKTICGGSGLNRTQARRALRGLMRLGFAQFSRGLFTEDGEVAGSGYRISREGHAWLHEHESDGAREAASTRQTPDDKSRDELSPCSTQDDGREG